MPRSPSRHAVKASAWVFITITAITLAGCFSALWLPADAWKDWNGRLAGALAAIIAAELASLTLIAALPLDRWLDGLRLKNQQSWVNVTAQLELIPKEFHYYFKVHAATLGASLVVELCSIQTGIALPDPLVGPIFRWGGLVGAAALNAVAVWHVFVLMRDLTVSAFSRYRATEDGSALTTETAQQKPQA